MSIHRLSRRHPTDPALGPVLDALRAPARAGELRREDATVAAFHRARLTPPTSTRSDMSFTARSAATRAAIATGVVVALSTGGFALAATDHLPTLPDQASDQATESVAKNRATTAPSTAPTTAPTTDATKTKTAKKPKKTKTPKPVDPSATSAPSPSLTGLCKAYQANDKSLHGKSLDSAAFTALAAAAAAAGVAGGDDAIANYCETLVGEPTQPTQPTKEAKPTKAPKPDKAAPTAKPTPTVKGKSADKGKSDTR